MGLRGSWEAVGWEEGCMGWGRIKGGVLGGDLQGGVPIGSGAKRP